MYFNFWLMCRYSGYQLITDFEFIIYSLKNLSFHLSNENCVWRPFQCLLISMVSSDDPSRSLLILVIFVLGSFSTLVCLEAYHFYRDFQRTDFQFHRFFFFFSFAVSVPLISVQFFIVSFLLSALGLILSFPTKWMTGFLRSMSFG